MLSCGHIVQTDQRGLDGSCCYVERPPRAPCRAVLQMQRLERKALTALHCRFPVSRMTSMAWAGKHLIQAILVQRWETNPFLARLVHHALPNADVIAGEPCRARWHRSPPMQLADSIASDTDGAKRADSYDSDRP